MINVSVLKLPDLLLCFKAIIIAACVLFQEEEMMRELLFWIGLLGCRLHSRLLKVSMLMLMQLTNCTFSDSKGKPDVDFLK